MIFKLIIWQLGAQLIFCLSDYHAPVQPKNQISNQQRITIVKAAKANDAHVIVEDALRYFDREPSNEQQYIAPYTRLMQLLPNEAPLLGLSSICHHADIPTTNVEFRLSTTAAHHAGHACSKVLANAAKAVKCIKSYDDSPIANAYYKKILNTYNKLVNEIAKDFFQQLHTKENLPISRALLESINYSPGIQTALEALMPDVDWNQFDTYEKKLNLLILFELNLLDAELIHALMQQSDKKTIFMCAGGIHISNIEPILKELGAKKVTSEGDNLIFENKEYQEPNALSITQLSSLLGSKETELPFLLRSTLRAQLCFDCLGANSTARSLVQGLFFGIITALFLFALPRRSIKKTLLYLLLSYYLVALPTIWHLDQPKRIHPPNENIQSIQEHLLPDHFN